MPRSIKATPTIEPSTAPRILTGNAEDTPGVLEAVELGDAVPEVLAESVVLGIEAVPSLESRVSNVLGANHRI